MYLLQLLLTFHVSVKKNDDLISSRASFVKKVILLAIQGQLEHLKKHFKLKN